MTTYTWVNHWNCCSTKTATKEGDFLGLANSWKATWVYIRYQFFHLFGYCHKNINSKRVENEIFDVLKNIVTMHFAFDSYIYLKALSHWTKQKAICSHFFELLIFKSLFVDFEHQFHLMWMVDGSFFYIRTMNFILDGSQPYQLNDFLHHCFPK